jgi:hypothetical protein
MTRFSSGTGSVICDHAALRLAKGYPVGPITRLNHQVGPALRLGFGYPGLPGTNPKQGIPGRIQSTRPTTYGTSFSRLRLVNIHCYRLISTTLTVIRSRGSGYLYLEHIVGVGSPGPTGCRVPIAKPMRHRLR